MHNKITMLSHEEEEEEPASPGARLMQTPHFNLCIFAVMGFATTIDVKLFKKEIEKTLLKHPRFSSLLIVKNKQSGKFSWKRTRVDVENHVFTPDLDPGMESSDEFVEDFTSLLSRNPMDLKKPLWEFHILNVKTSDAKSTVIFKFHHSIGDGVSLISLLLACSKKAESLPVIPSKKQKLIITDHHNKGLMMIKRLFVLFWTLIMISFNTLIGCAWFLATVLFLKDTKTPIKGARGVEHSPKRFVHRIVNFDDIKLVKTAMNVTINDVAVGIAEAGLSRYLNMRYEKINGESGALVVKKTNFLPRNLRLRSAVAFNLRLSPIIEDLGEIMEKEKELKGWGNLVGFALVPLTMVLQDDPLAYIHRVKATMDRKKLSLEPNYIFIALKLIIKLFGIKLAAAATNAIFWNTTLAFSNIVGPQEEIILFGHPLCYIAPTVSGFPQALLMHFQSYANKFIIALAADEKLIPNPHQLCDEMQKSLENIIETVIKRGLIKGSELC